MKSYQKSILESIGQTPLVELQRLGKEEGCRIFGKVESFNPSGSIKARTALRMIEEAEKSGALKPGATIMEATSGNQGIALAMIGAAKGYKVRIVMPESMSEERRSLIKGYGAEVILAPLGKDIKEEIEGALNLMLDYAAKDSTVFLPRQFENPENPKAHEFGTGREIIEQMGELPIHGFSSGFGTGGSISGVGKTLLSQYPDVRIAVAEPDQAAILSGLPIGHHSQQGIGDGVIPIILDQSVITDIILVTDKQAEETARQLAAREGILCGVSSGTNVFSALELAKKLGPGHNIVTLLPDTGERYLSSGLYK